MGDFIIAQVKPKNPADWGYINLRDWVSGEGNPRGYRTVLFILAVRRAFAGSRRAQGSAWISWQDLWSLIISDVEVKEDRDVSLPSEFFTREGETIGHLDQSAQYDRVKKMRARIYKKVTRAELYLKQVLRIDKKDKRQLVRKQQRTQHQDMAFCLNLQCVLDPAAKSYFQDKNQWYNAVIQLIVTGKQRD